MRYLNVSELVSKKYTMITYISVFFLTAISSLVFDKKNNQLNKLLFLLLLIFIFCFATFKYQIGGDWKRHEFLYSFFAQIELNFNVLLGKEFLYTIISDVFYSLSTNIIYLNTFYGFIFFSSLYLFLIHQKLPFLSLCLFFPVGIVMMQMGIVRQSLALSMLMLFFLSIQKKKKFYSIITFYFAVGFHISAFIFFPLLILNIFSLSINFIKYKIPFLFFYMLTILLLICINLMHIFNLQLPYDANTIIRFIFGLAFDLENSPTWPNLFSIVFSYIVINETVNLGWFLRFTPSVIALLIYIYSITKLNYEKNLFLDYSLIIALFCIFLYSFGFSTLSDRINYFLVPFYVTVFSNYTYNSIGERYFLIKKLFFIGLLSIIFSSWLLFSPFAKSNWMPYNSIFLVK